MIRYEELVGTLRFYPSNAEQMAPYDAVCTIVWRSNSEVELRGLHGVMSRSRIFMLAAWLNKRDVKYVYIKRGPGRKMPMAEEKPNNWLCLNVENVVAASKTRRPISHTA